MHRTILQKLDQRMQTVVMLPPIGIRLAAVLIGVESVILIIGVIMIEEHHRRQAPHNRTQHKQFTAQTIRANS